MGKIKIGLIILGSIALVGLVVAGVGIAKSSEIKEADNVNVISKAEYVTDEVIVKFKGDEKPFQVLKVPQGKVKEEVEKYQKRADVIYAEPNYIAYALWTPNDPYYGYQWHLDNSVYGGIQMEEAWELLGAPGTPGLGVTVAVVDTGIRKGTDLANTCFVAGYDFVNNDSDPTDDNGHGTHVAGTVAQSTNNTLGVAGVAFKSCLMPVRVLDATGVGTYANVAAGIRYAADNGAKVINLSLGGSELSDTLEEALAYAYGKEVTLVAAAGNDGEGGPPSYPAAYDNYVIAVGATQYDETRVPYSTTGSYLDLAAPGGNNNLDLNNDGYADGVLQQTFQKTGRRITWGYYFFQGTSMATPHVSGVAALLLSKGNATTPDQIRTALQNTAECLGGTCPNNTYGYGLVNAFAALGWTAVPQCTSDSQCDDALYCNGAETCVSGVCKSGTPVDCSALSDQCNDGVCQEVVGGYECVAKPKANGTVCEDGQFCTVRDTCQYGVCTTGSTQSCDDNNSCTIDSCDETNDMCVNAPITTCSGSAIDGCCPAGCTYETDVDCPTAVMCWSGTNLHLYRAADQSRKFCMCAQGSYGYKSYKYNRSTKIVYKYVNTADNTIWDVTSLSSYGPIYSVTCTDDKAYPTNIDYTYPK